MKKGFSLMLLWAVSLFLLVFSSWVSAEAAPVMSEARTVAQYNYIIHILAMLLIGFGFLMVFVRRYGFGAVTGTYLVVAVGLPLYILLRANGIYRHGSGAWSIACISICVAGVVTGTALFA